VGFPSFQPALLTADTSRQVKTETPEYVYFSWSFGDSYWKNDEGFVSEYSKENN
jgi:hypothetical protein